LPTPVTPKELFRLEKQRAWRPSTARCTLSDSLWNDMEITMKRSRVRLGTLALLGVLLSSGWLYARQQRPAAASQERAQDLRPVTADSPFSLLPGFKIERVTPADKTESYIVITFDSLGRPVVSQSSSGNGVEPRILLDKNGDGIFESEQVVSAQINTCHGLFYDGTTLYADCLGRVDGDPVPPPAPAPAPAAAGAGPVQGAPAGGGGRGGGTGFIPGLYKLTDANGDGTADKVERINRYISGMGDHGPHAVRRAPDGTLNVMIGNNTFVTDDLVDTATTPNFRNLKERQFLPAFRAPRFGNSTKEGTHGTLLRVEEDKKKFAVLFSGLRNT
jgi:hypothetical protein